MNYKLLVFALFGLVGFSGCGNGNRNQVTSRNQPASPGVLRPAAVKIILGKPTDVPQDHPSTQFLIALQKELLHQLNSKLKDSPETKERLILLQIIKDEQGQPSRIIIGLDTQRGPVGFQHIMTGIIPSPHTDQDIKQSSEKVANFILQKLQEPAQTTGEQPST
jgi:hypothetical protein